MKDKVRSCFLEIRRRIPQEEKKTWDGLIQERLIQSDLYKNTDRIFIYISMKNEAGTSEIIRRAMDDGKTVAVPVSLRNRELYFVPYHGTEILVRTPMGVMEPVADRTNELIPDENSIMVVPGVAFDESGHRMGYGGGYYDTYIDKYCVKNTVAIAFEAQIQKSIPYEEHDQPMKYIITENRIIGGAQL